MRLSPDLLSKIDASAPTFGYRVQRVALPSISSRTARAVKQQIEQHHQGAFVIFEEAVRFIVAFESFQFERKNRPEESTPFVMLLSRVRADLLSIRHLLQLGQESAALAVARVFMEDIELAMATAVDPEFATAFMESNDPDNFWTKKVAYGKIYPYVERFLRLGKQGKNVSAAHISHHKGMKTYLSQHVHPNFSSAFNLVAPAALESPGRFALRPMGWFGESSGRLCLYIADEIQAFSATCISAFIAPNPPPALADYMPSKALATFMRPAHSLQTLIHKHAASIYKSYTKRSSEWSNKAEIPDQT